MKNKQTIGTKILNLTNKYGYFDSSIARKHFRKYNGTSSLDGVVMRTARRMAANGTLHYGSNWGTFIKPRKSK